MVQAAAKENASVQVARVTRTKRVRMVGIVSHRTVELFTNPPLIDASSFAARAPRGT
jgi:hypothetical protein